MKRNWIAAGLAALITWPAWASAQRAPRAERPRVGVFSFSGSRARIGVIVNTRADRETDKIGARLEGVTPGGPAERAGLKAGDVITKFNGIALGGTEAEGEDESGPGMKLVDLARALDPGDTVRVEYRRGTEAKQATVVAAEVETAWSFRLPRPGHDLEIDPDIRLHLDEEFPGFGFWFGSPWGRVELVDLNPDLGDYFGAREGVLVVKAPGDSALPLKGGDVIQSIGGRKPTSPQHAMRILRSYDAGERVTIDVLRKQKRVTLTWTVPERERPSFRRHRERDRERDGDPL